MKQRENSLGPICLHLFGRQAKRCKSSATVLNGGKDSCDAAEEQRLQQQHPSEIHTTFCKAINTHRLKPTKTGWLGKPPSQAEDEEMPPTSPGNLPRLGGTAAPGRRHSVLQPFILSPPSRQQGSRSRRLSNGALTLPPR